MELLDIGSGSYAVALVQSIVALAGVCGLAVVLLRFAAGRGLGRAPSGKMLELVERLPLDARSAVCVVRAGDKMLLVGTADGVAPTMLGEVEGKSFRALVAEVEPAKAE